MDAAYIRGIGLAASKSDSGYAYYLYNGHGDTVQLSGGDGTVTFVYSYDAFGNEREADGEDTNPFRYSGEYFDGETGSYYLRARYYDPATGRFLTEDGYGFMQYDDPLSLNLYTYCHNNPVMFSDPSGNNPATATLPNTNILSELISGLTTLSGLALSWSGSMWWLMVADLAFPIGDTIYIAGIGVCKIIDAIAMIGVENVIRAICEVPDIILNGLQMVNNALDTFIQWIGDQINSGVESVKKWFEKTFGDGSPSPGDPDWNGGFNSFYKLKKYLGSAGKGNDWHHIVEQSQIEKSGFAKDIIHNVNNVVSLSKDVHKQISAYYGTKISAISGNLTIRDWLAGQSFEFQYQFGLDLIKKYGGLG